MHIQRAELMLDGYGKSNWHLIPPTKEEYLEAAQIFANHQSGIGHPIKFIATEDSTPSTELHESWNNAVNGVLSQRVWATKEILQDAS